jgi:dTDP-4-dehydrorhamnose reductase
MPTDVIVFGANGLLGSTLCTQLEILGFRILRQSRDSNADLTCNPVDQISVHAALKGLRSSAIINLVANSNVDFCENNITDAYLANIKTVEILTSEIMNMASPPHLIQISTDHLYNGTGPHSEGDALPINIYALSKLCSEMVALKAGGTVIRTNFFGRSNHELRISFSDWIYNSLISGHSFTVFDDVLFSALHMKTLSICIGKIIESKRQGIFNVGSRNGISKAKFAKVFADLLGLDTKNMNIGSFKDAALSAPRPQDMRMDVSSFESEFSIILPDMLNEIKFASDEYRRN